ncbi:unnamed protein product [Spirodela intermedia]|uniref:Uncharacterized protein n=1 Tax=Spirodela intermedia TaxID=51605 RepID=A0A7I8K4I7_SPIIN|nr:unnamed protein product [Spirodela intermedia]
MRNDAPRIQGGAPRTGKGGGFFSLRSVSGYLRIVSSGASSVASTVKSAGASVASSIVEREDDQVQWAGFDKLEAEGGILRQVLLLGYSSGFQVWDVEEADDVHQLVSRHDGPVSFLQMQRRPASAMRYEDRFADAHPLLAIAGDSSLPGGSRNSEHHQKLTDGSPAASSSVHFYSLKAHAYVHSLDFASAVYTIRCSPRVVAVSQANQIHCFDAATLEREYTILTYPVASRPIISGSVAYGPLAVGTRWLAYSGSPVLVPDSGRVSPEHLAPSTSLPSSSNGSLVAHYAKESRKQVVSGLVTLGDIGYKKLSKYCSELLPDGSSGERGTLKLKTNGSIDGYFQDDNSSGMVIVRDLLSKSVVVQFRAHTNPIAALCFDPSGTLLLTASVLGHNMNVFCIVSPFHGGSTGSEKGVFSYMHLYKLQRGVTNAVIHDISFSSDSQWIMISSSRGTSHLFAIPPSESATDPGVSGTGGLGPLARTAAPYPNSSGRSLPVTLSVVSRIRNGSNWWRSAVNGAAAAATGRISPFSGAIASAFHNCSGVDDHPEPSSLRKNHHLLVFSPSGCVVQYVLSHMANGDISRPDTAIYEPTQGSGAVLVVEATQKWDICHKQNRRDRGDNVDIYGDHGSGGSAKPVHKVMRKGAGEAAKPVLAAEERQHLYISEVELCTHAAKTPLWVKSEISFHAWVEFDMSLYVDGLSGGEIGVEQIPSRAIEARAKGLIPVFESLQMHRFQPLITHESSENHFFLLQHDFKNMSAGQRQSPFFLGCSFYCATVLVLINFCDGLLLLNDVYFPGK